MATQLYIYRVSDKAILARVENLDGSDYIFSNEATYPADEKVVVDGEGRVFGLDTDTNDVKDFTGTPPSDIFETLEGDYTDPDPENWVEKTPEKYRFTGDFSDIELNT